MTPHSSRPRYVRSPAATRGCEVAPSGIEAWSRTYDGAREGGRMSEHAVNAEHRDRRDGTERALVAGRPDHRRRRSSASSRPSTTARSPGSATSATPGPSGSRRRFRSNPTRMRHPRASTSDWAARSRPPRATCSSAARCAGSTSTRTACDSRSRVRRTGPVNPCPSWSGSTAAPTCREPATSAATTRRALVLEQGVMVVTVTYRLGVLGFLGDGEPGGGPPTSACSTSSRRCGGCGSASAGSAGIPSR